MDLQIGGEMNELLSTKMCSPLIVYFGVVVLCGLSAYLTRDHLKRHNTYKMDNLLNLYTFNEAKLIIVLGLTIFGLCQYNKTTLAWVFLIFPIIYCIIQGAIIHIHVSSGIQNAPKVNTLMPESHYGLSGGAAIMPQDTSQQRQASQGIYVPPPTKSEFPVNTSSSMSMGGSQMGGSQMGGSQMGGSGMGGPSGMGGTGSGGTDSYASTYF